MEPRTLTRSDLAEAVFRKAGLSRIESAELVEMVLDEICLGIERHGTVMLSTFGTFKVREKNARTGRNPKTGEEAVISQRRVVSFKASHVLKDRVFRAHRMRKDKGKARVLEDTITR